MISLDSAPFPLYKGGPPLLQVYLLPHLLPFHSTQLLFQWVPPAATAEQKAPKMSYEHFPHFGTAAIHVGQEPEQWDMNQVRRHFSRCPWE